MPTSLHRLAAIGLLVQSGFLVPGLAIVSVGAAEIGNLKTPSWLEASIGLKESFDDNVFLSGVDSRFLPATISVPDGSVAALENSSSWVTTLAPKVGVNLVPFFTNAIPLQTAVLSYAPEFALYHDQRSENYTAHRASASLQGKVNAWSFAAEETFVYVDGNEYGPTYPGGLLNAYATATARERREQTQNRATINIRHDWKRSFVRASASGAFFNLLTEKIDTSGYQNYADRYDVNGGLDFGFKAMPKLALTLGYRYGHQYQQQFDFSPYSSSSDYQRLLAGIEGKPWSWLELKIQGGPDFRVYEQNTAEHTTPMNDLRPLCYYVEAAATATLSSRDTIGAKLKQWQWVSSTGKIPYFDTAMELGYRRKCSDQIEFEVSGRYVSSDYSSGNILASERFDHEFTVGIGLKYTFNAHFSMTASYSHELGRNAMENVVDEETRGFTRNLFSLGVNLKL